MAHAAELNANNIVIQVLTFDNSIESDLIEYTTNLLGGTWVQTSYNTHGGVHTLGGTPLHKNYAGIGYIWDGTGFAAPKPYDSWSLNTDTYQWDAPIPMPTDDKLYQWDEATLAWVEISTP